MLPSRQPDPALETIHAGSGGRDEYGLKVRHHSPDEPMDKRESSNVPIYKLIQRPEDA
jgi:hypothetical protein